MILDKLFNKRIICRKDNKPYLTRYYIFRKPVNWMPSVYLHCFHESDEDEQLHNHPWGTSVSLILKGSYLEEYKDKKGNVKKRTLKPGMLNFITANKFHRVDLLNDKVWTLFISGAKQQRWGFWDRFSNKYWDFTEHDRIKAEIESKREAFRNELKNKKLA